MKGENMASLKTVAEIEAALQERARADEVLSRVDKGNRGKFTYIPWNETARMLNAIFGVFGWSTYKVASVDNFEQGIYIYDGSLIVRALDGEQVVEKQVTGRGVGIVGKTSLEKGDREAHDTAAKGARSDFLSVAAKLLGEAFGIFLYDKGDPAHTESYVAAHANGSAQAATTNETSVAQEVTKPAPTASADGKVGLASPKQAGVLRTNGWTDAQIAAIPDYPNLKAIMDGCFGKGPKVAPPKTVAGSANLTIVPKTGTDDDF